MTRCMARAPCSLASASLALLRSCFAKRRSVSLRPPRSASLACTARSMSHTQGLKTLNPTNAHRGGPQCAPLDPHHLLSPNRNMHVAPLRKADQTFTNIYKHSQAQNHPTIPSHPAPPSPTQPDLAPSGKVVWWDKADNVTFVTVFTRSMARVPCRPRTPGRKKKRPALRCAVATVRSASLTQGDQQNLNPTNAHRAYASRLRPTPPGRPRRLLNLQTKES
jgi:hypothetical protein